jgi:hypothetical protein
MQSDHFCSGPDVDIIVTISNSGQKCSQAFPWLFHIMAV